MKRKEQKEEINDLEEQRAVDEVRALEAGMGGEKPLRPQGYWATLIVRTNQRIDNVTSGKAISLSWAARVAIPGVAAILFFFIGLHYYVPDRPSRESSIRSLVASLPVAQLDSVLADPSRLHESLSVADLGENVFEFSTDQVSDYLVQTGETQTVLESLTDEQIKAIVSTLDSENNRRM